MKVIQVAIKWTIKLGVFVDNELHSKDRLCWSTYYPSIRIWMRSVSKNYHQALLWLLIDFQLLTKRSQWQWVVNYCAHHFHLSIFLVVHSHQHTKGLYNALKIARNLYLTYSNNSKYFLKSLYNGKYFSFFCKQLVQWLSEPNENIILMTIWSIYCLPLI